MVDWTAAMSVAQKVASTVDSKAALWASRTAVRRVGPSDKRRAAKKAEPRVSLLVVCLVLP